MVHEYRNRLQFLRSMERLPYDVLEKFLKDEYVMLHPASIWNGIWADMFIATMHIHALWPWSRWDSWYYPETKCTEEVGTEAACIQSHNQKYQ